MPTHACAPTKVIRGTMTIGPGTDVSVVLLFTQSELEATFGAGASFEPTGMTVQDNPDITFSQLQAVSANNFETVMDIVPNGASITPQEITDAFSPVVGGMCGWRFHTSLGWAFTGTATNNNASPQNVKVVVKGRTVRSPRDPVAGRVPRPPSGPMVGVVGPGRNIVSPRDPAGGRVPPFPTRGIPVDPAVREAISSGIKKMQERGQRAIRGRGIRTAGSTGIRFGRGSRILRKDMPVSPMAPGFPERFEARIIELIRKLGAMGGLSSNQVDQILGLRGFRFVNVEQGLVAGRRHPMLPRGSFVGLSPVDQITDANLAWLIDDLRDLLFDLRRLRELGDRASDGERNSAVERLARIMDSIKGKPYEGLVNTILGLAIG